MWAKKPPPIISRPTGRQTRSLHTQRSQTILIQGKTVGTAIQTAHDRKKEESYPDYRKRSLKEITDLIPKELHKKDLFVFKLNQTAVDPETKGKGKEIKHFEIGHIAAAVVQIDGDDIKFVKDSVVSKTLQAGFEEQEDYVDKKFISKEYPPSDYPIKEFYLLMDSEQFGTRSVEMYQELLWRLKFEDRPYVLHEDACGHALHEAFTGEKLPPRVSAQTAFQKTMAKVTEENPVLHDVLNKTMRDLGMSKDGFEVGQDFLDYKALKNQSNPKPTSS